jgi:hypothetical protein
MTHDFILGAVAMGFLIAAVFFFRFWRESRDRLFALFASAFLLLAFNRVLLVILHEDQEVSLAPYIIRLLAFIVILAAILDKNLRRT